jgi:seryl-tRNA synthetase
VVEGDEFIVGLKRENDHRQLEVTQLMSELKVIEAKTAAARRKKEELKQKLEHNFLSIEKSNHAEERAGRNGEDSLLITPTGEGAGAVQLFSVPSPTRLSGRSPGRSSRPKTPQVPKGQSDTATRRGSRLDPAGLSEAQAVTKPAEQQQPLYGEYDQKFASA